MIDIDYQNINRLSNVVYQNAVAKGFHEAGKTETEVQKLARYTANLHGEVSELWEAARKGQLQSPCDKDAVVQDLGGSRSLTCAEEELADIIIRALDTSAALGLRIGDAIKAKHEYNLTRSHKHGGKLA
jgi:NTP pyrophosphatase (non-canonical NTP hydrolase)